MHSHQKAQVLLIVSDGKPIFDEHNARAHQHLFEFGGGMEKFLVVIVCIADAMRNVRFVPEADSCGPADNSIHSMAERFWVLLPCNGKINFSSV